MQSEADHESFIKQFEDTSLSLEQWHHRQHLWVALLYLLKFDEQNALEKVRYGIQKFNDAHGIKQTVNSGYHDTLTIFLVKGISALLNELPESSFEKKLKAVTNFFSNFKDIASRYFSPEHFDSWPSRQGWNTPDKRSMEEWLEECKIAGHESN